MTGGPSCVGDYARRAAPCDGDATDPRPCTWRAKCYGWQQECQTLALDPYTEAERLRAEDGPEAFAARCRELGDKWGPPPPLPAHRRGGKRRAPAQARRVPDDGPTRRLELFAWHIVDRLRVEIGPIIFPADEAVLVGQLVAVDTLAHRGRLDVAVRTGPSSSVPVLSLTLCPPLEGVEAAVRLEGAEAVDLAAATGAVRLRTLTTGGLPSALVLRRACVLEPLVGAVASSVRAIHGKG